jgi:hypothetical protein
MPQDDCRQCFCYSHILQRATLAGCRRVLGRRRRRERATAAGGRSKDDPGVFSTVAIRAGGRHDPVDGVVLIATTPHADAASDFATRHGVNPAPLVCCKNMVFF